MRRSAWGWGTARLPALVPGGYATVGFDFQRSHKNTACKSHNALTVCQPSLESFSVFVCIKVYLFRYVGRVASAERIFM